MKKIVNVLLILFTIIFIGNTSFAVEIDTKQKEIQVQSILKVAGIKDDLRDLEKYVDDDPDIDKLTDKAGVILGLIQLVGTIISVGVLMVIGIKYMISSIEERAEYKKTFMSYIIGAFLLFTATTLPNLIYNAVHNL